MDTDKPNNDQGNPAWKPLLDSIPSELHGIVRPHLETWDKNYQQGVQSVRDEYKDLEPYRQFAEQGVEADWLTQAAMLTSELQADPTATFKKLNDAWELGFVEKGSTNSNDPDPDNEYEFDGTDITKHPEFQKLQTQLENVEGNLRTKAEQEELDAQVKQFESDLDEALKDKEGINRTLVTAFASQGLSIEDSIAEVQKLTGHVATPPPNEEENNNPTVMGSGGTAGSGTPTEPVSYGSMKNDDLDGLVQNMLEKAQQGTQG